MAHSNATDGFRTDNAIIKRVEPILSVTRFKNEFIHGVETADNEGNVISDETYQQFINYAISMLEYYLDISITPRTEVEEKDYFGNDYWDWGFFQLNNLPVIDIQSIAVTYLRDINGQPDVVLNIPPNWVRIREHDGLLRLVPNNQFPASLQIDASGTFFPEVFRRYSNVPQLWTITYTAGFKDGYVPSLVNLAIGYIAAILVYNASADLLLGSGIASTSISLDGLSQGLVSTASAENTTFSARIKEARSLLYGDTINSPNRGILRILKDFWQGTTTNII